MSDCGAYSVFSVPGWGSVLAEAMLALCPAPARIEDVTGFDQPGAARDRLLRVNPLGQVPTLLLPDGTVMTESAAIALLLSERYPEAGLAPAPGTPLRPGFLRRLVWLAANVYPTFTYGDYPERWRSVLVVRSGRRRISAQFRAICGDNLRSVRRAAGLVGAARRGSAEWGGGRRASWCCGCAPAARLQSPEVSFQAPAGGVLRTGSCVEPVRASLSASAIPFSTPRGSRESGERLGRGSSPASLPGCPAGPLSRALACSSRRVALSLSTSLADPRSGASPGCRFGFSAMGRGAALAVPGPVPAAAGEGSRRYRRVTLTNGSDSKAARL